MQFEAKVIWHQAHANEAGDVVLWQTKLYGSNDGHGIAIEAATKEETFDKSATYVVTINAAGDSVPELRNPIGTPLGDPLTSQSVMDDVMRLRTIPLKPRPKAKAPKKAAAKKR